MLRCVRESDRAKRATRKRFAFPELTPYDGRSGTINKRWNIIENRVVEADI